MAALAMPRNRRNPNTSVKVVTTTPRRLRGPLQYVVETEAAPTKPAMTMLLSIATPSTKPRLGFCFQASAIPATKSPNQDTVG